MSTPWAVLLCKFSDVDDVSSETYYRRLLTNDGSGSENLVRYFADVSHGAVDISGSRVFGWLDLGFRRDQYIGNGARTSPDQVNRDGLVDGAQAAARHAGVPLQDFAAFIVCLNTRGTDLFGGTGHAVCSPDSEGTAIAHEMGHGFGFDHSRRQGSLDHYRDPWDLMSAMTVYAADSPEYRLVGPILNAWNMRYMGWLDETRVWKNDAPAFDETVELHPLVRRDMPGFLAAELDQRYLVEFRPRSGWDRGIPGDLGPAVLVHRCGFDASYVMETLGSRTGLRTGDVFQAGDETSGSSRYARVDVISVDDSTARVRLRFRQAAPSKLAIFYRTSGDWLAWRLFDGDRWHGEEVFNEHHPVPTSLAGGPLGPPKAPVAVAGWAGNHLAVFFRGDSDRLHVKLHRGGRWRHHEQVDGGGVLTSDPAAITFDENYPDTGLGMFYRTEGDWLAWRLFDGSRWHGEAVFNGSDVPTRLASAPSAIAGWAGSRVGVFFRGDGDRLHRKAHQGGRWHDHAVVDAGGVLSSDASLLRLTGDRLAVFYRTAGDWLAWRLFDGERWHGEEVFDASSSTPTRIGSSPTAVAGWAGNEMAVFFRGEGDRLYWKAHQGGRWHSPARVEGGGVLSSNPSAVAFA